MTKQEIRHQLRIQNNRHTDQPIFVVEERVLVITEEGYGEDHCEWVNTESGDYEVANVLKAHRLNLLRNNHRETGSWKKFFYLETWKFVTSCFTEKGCQEYLKINGHNLREPRIYAYGSFRNEEYQTLRTSLMGGDS